MVLHPVGREYSFVVYSVMYRSTGNAFSYSDSGTGCKNDPFALKEGHILLKV